MEKVKQWLKIGLPFLELAVDALQNADDNDTGADDVFAQFLGFAIKGFKSILSDDEEGLKNAKAEFANNEIGLPISEVTKY